MTKLTDRELNQTIDSKGESGRILNRMSEILKRIDETYERFQRLGLGAFKSDAKIELNTQTSVNNEAASFKKSFEEDRKLLNEEIEKIREELENAKRAKSDFLSVISHEIRTPMNAIIGMSGLLNDTTLSNEQRDYVETIRSSGDRLLTLINDILDFTEIDSGKIALENQPFELRNCIADSVNLISNLAYSKNLEFIYYIDPQVPENIFGDITRLRQILVNLLSNAIKFTNTGDISLSVVQLNKSSVDSINSNDIELEFSIRDSGIGIKDSETEKIFKEFSLADSSLSRKHGGTGLGLAICKKLVDLMGGKIWFESKENTGTTFFFTLKVKKSDNAGVKEYLNSDVQNLKDKHVLIIDENRKLRQILSLQTQMWGMIPKTTSSGYEAIDWLKKYKFDVVLLDAGFNEKYNDEVLKEIRKVKGQNFPVIALSGTEAETRTGNVLFTVYLQKPVHQEKLFDKLNTIFTKDKTTIKITEVTNKLSDTFPLKILIAEDNIINQKIACRILAQMGYIADVVGNGIEVLETLQRQHYDIVFMDVQMPELDGIQTTSRILERWIPQERPKIIAMTANATQGDMEKCMHAGMDDFLSKPILLDELKHTLEKWGKNPITKVTGALSYTNEDLIDFETVKNLKEITGIDDTSFITEVVNLYSKQAPKIISDIRRCWQKNDLQALVLSSHSLRGASMNMGAKLIQELTKNIENKCHKGDVAEIGKDIEKLEYIYERTINEYKKLV